MKLIINNNEIDNPRLSVIEDEIEQLDWLKSNMVELIKNEEDKLIFHGNYEDGFDIEYQDGKTEYITVDNKPKAVSEFITVVHEYIHDLDAWKQRHVFAPYITDENGNKVKPKIFPPKNPMVKTLKICHLPIIILAISLFIKRYELAGIIGIWLLFALYVSFRQYWWPVIQANNKEDEVSNYSQE